MRTTEAMAANKLNRLHIHASDTQSWPLEIPSLHDLAMKGAYSQTQIWRTEDLEAVQLHGKKHGGQAYVEIDLPVTLRPAVMLTHISSPLKTCHSPITPQDRRLANSNSTPPRSHLSSRPSLTIHFPAHRPQLPVPSWRRQTEHESLPVRFHGQTLLLLSPPTAIPGFCRSCHFYRNSLFPYGNHVGGNVARLESRPATKRHHSDVAR